MTDASDKKFRQLINALTRTTRALTGAPELQIVMEGETPTRKQQGKPQLHLPPFPSRADAETLNAYKGRANREAFIYRYGDAHITAKSLKAPDQVIKEVINPLEAAWTEAQGRQDYKGTASGLDALRQREAGNLLDETAEYSHRRQLGYVLGAALRREMGENLVPAETTLLKQYKKHLTPEVKEWLRGAARHLASPEDRGRIYRDLLNILDLAQPEEEDPPPETESGENNEQKDQEGASTGEGRTDETPDETQEGTPENSKEAEAGGSEETTEENEQGEQARQGNRHAFGDDSPDYHIFTTRYDATIPAGKLLSAPELERLQARYRNVTAGTRGTVGRMAIRLQRLLLAQANLDWRFDQEEGVLDPKKLPQIIASGDPYPYRRQRSRPERDTVVTLLLDNSGSMRGRPIEMTALSADILTRTLERCGVKTEVLGFTTQTWKGGQSRLDWISEGSPENPGRLNDNLQIIYKDADKSYQAARGAFPVMLADDLLKENIDGENLLWAYKRLVKRPEKRKILLVISDGAPVDYATDKHNQANFLDKHLRTVVKGIENQDRVELLAIGIGHDVRRYYKNAVTIQNPAALSETMVERMVNLFSGRT